MKDPASGWIKADITINGKPLNFVQALTVRMAVTQFWMQLQAGFAKELGPIGEGYQSRASEIIKMVQGEK
jgi:hypothetical protein